MTQPRYVSIVFTLLLVLGFIGSALAQTQTPPQTQTHPNRASAPKICLRSGS